MKELRIGLVLYGGVSLAVYINGIVTELWHLLRASQARAGGTAPPADGTAEIYRDLLEALDRETGCEQLRVVVDAVAGTSAGGVNGTVLAKAVVDGGDASVLNRVWIEDADIAKLKAAPSARAPWWLRGAVAGLASTLMRGQRKAIESIPGISVAWRRDHLWALRTARGDQTLLDGNSFSGMIARTLRAMERPQPAPALLPDRGTFDLFLTRTDLHGWPRHLPVCAEFHPTPLYERTHAHWMHFRRGCNGGPLDDDFGLTYATRTTAGFPLAFAPVGYREMKAAFKEAAKPRVAPPLADFSRRHLREHLLADFPSECAWMIDGGVLDNKPFSHVARAIERKPADHEVYRAVIYAEPDPETHIDPPPKEVPRAVAVASGLYKLFRHEPIFDDLHRLDERNAKVERIREAVEAAMPATIGAARDAAAGLGIDPNHPTPDDLKRWSRACNECAARIGGGGYPGYVLLKARRAADVIAELLCGALRFPHPSRHGFAVRRIVRAWLADKGAFEPPALTPAGEFRLSRLQLELLDAFDVPFRLRRIRALVRAANGAYAALPDEPGDRAERRARIDAVKRTLADAAFAFGTAVEDSRAIEERVTAALGGLGRDELDRLIRELADDPAAVAKHYDALLGEVYEALRAPFAALAAEQSRNVAGAVAAAASPHDRHVVDAYVSFAFVDQFAFPMMDAANVEDLIQVRTMRISPQDAQALSVDPHRLKGRGLGAFAAFLRREDREHDLMWGRLDGAERLIDLIICTAAGSTAGGTAALALRKRFLRKAVERILDEEGARCGTAMGEHIEALRGAPLLSRQE